MATSETWHRPPHDAPRSRAEGLAQPVRAPSGALPSRPRRPVGRHSPEVSPRRLAAVPSYADDELSVPAEGRRIPYPVALGLSLLVLLAGIVSVIAWSVGHR